MTAPGQTPAPTVLQVNIRLSEGGAAQVARTLGEGLPARGFDTQFVYGYGPHGRASRSEQLLDAHRLTPLVSAMGNYVSHQLRGRESRIASLPARKKFNELVMASDLVHLHAIHSYMADYQAIIEPIIAAKKPVVWTMHDHWLMTGRCAQPAGCDRWEVGCGKCPNLKAYPSSLLDFSREQHSKKRTLLKRLSESTSTTYVSCAHWLAEEMTTSGFDNVVTINNSVDYAFWRSVPRSRHRESGPHRLVFVCRDLRDRAKVRWDILETIAGVPGVELTIVGDNSPITIDNARHIPAITNRVAMARELARHDDLLFTSDVDYFPLTVIEALSTGLGVVGVDSKALRELSGLSQVRIFSNAEHLRNILSGGPQIEMSSVDEFSPDRMVNEYGHLYNSILRVA